MPSTVAEVRGDVVAEGLPDRTEPPRRAAGESATRLCPCMDRRATFVAPAHALAEPLFPARPERRSALMAPIPRLLADGDVSLFDLPLGDLRPWMADRRLSHGIAMACRPRSSFPVCRPLVRGHAPGGRTRGPTTSSSPAVACRGILSMRLPTSPSGRYRRRDGWHEGATPGRSARLDCAHPPSSAIVGTCRTPSTGAPARLAADASARGTSLDRR